MQQRVGILGGNTVQHPVIYTKTAAVRFLPLQQLWPRDCQKNERCSGPTFVKFASPHPDRGGGFVGDVQKSGPEVLAL